MPAGLEDEARAARGGCWFKIGGLQVHLGAPCAPERNPSRRASGFHCRRPCRHGDQGKTGRLQGPGGRPIEGCDRRHIDDSFGNQIELIEPHAK
jgi:hypothetical protein